MNLPTETTTIIMNRSLLNSASRHRSIIWCHSRYFSAEKVVKAPPRSLAELFGSQLKSMGNNEEARPETTANPFAKHRGKTYYQSPYETNYPKSENIPIQPLQRRPYERILTIRKAVRVTAKGKHVKYDAWCVAGDRRGSMGVAHAQSTQPSKAVQTALRNARSSMRYYDLFEGRTLYHDIDLKFRNMRIRFFSKPPGNSVRAQHTIYDLCQALGMQDLSAQILIGKTNPVTITRAFMHALEYCHRTPREIASTRGLHLREVNHAHSGV